MDPVTSGADPTTPLEVFNNATDVNGGDSTLYNLNVFYNVSRSSAY
jgi:Amt family ammonium transporter